jgi:hypothetical protein
MIYCPQCRSQIDTFAKVCPQCTSDLTVSRGYAYGSGGEFQLADMLLWLFLIGIVMKGCELVGCKI